MAEDTGPKLDAYADTHGFLHIWCKYCHKWHHHGQGGGHRGEHCIIVNSPYKETGYELVYKGPWTDEIHKQYREKKPVQCRGCHAYLSPVLPIKCPVCGWERKIGKKDRRSEKQEKF